MKLSSTSRAALMSRLAGQGAPAGAGVPLGGGMPGMTAGGPAGSAPAVQLGEAAQVFPARCLTAACTVRQRL